MKHAPVLREPNAADYTMMLLTALFLASSFVAIRVAVPSTGPIWLAAIRVGLGFLALLPYALWRGMVWPDSGGQWMLIFAMSLLNMTVPFSLLAWAAQTVDAGVLALLMGTGPFFALVGSHYMTRDDRMTPRKIVSVALGFAGILVVIGPSALKGVGNSPLMAQMAALGASLCYVIAGLLMRRIRMPLGRLACLALGIGMATLVPAALLLTGPPPAGVPLKAGLALLYLGLFPTGIAYIMRFHLIRSIGYTRFALSINLIPVFGVLLGAGLLGEKISPTILIALGLVLSGLFVSAGGAKPVQPKIGE